MTSSCEDCIKSFLTLFGDTSMQKVQSTSCADFNGCTIPVGSILVLKDEDVTSETEFYTMNWVIDGPILSISDCFLITVVPLGYLHSDSKGKRIILYSHTIVLTQKTIVPFANNPTERGMPKKLIGQIEIHETSKTNDFWNSKNYQKHVSVHQIVYILQQEEIQYSIQKSITYLLEMLCSILYEIETNSLQMGCSIRPFRNFRLQYAAFRDLSNDVNTKIESAIFPAFSKHEEQIYLYWLSFQPEYQEYIELLHIEQIGTMQIYETK